ncbi:PAQR family membrane homeostasis protein TrhA [Corynebacterium riegelii]|uniref:PAQR family membrane homeostasis protein TrhA n=1 Tax=Corynebacterium riegelii TaxID=156976 RepID=UPI002889D95D|nr:hemolysin III family protein [Corynebacterium riegelii]
MAVITEGTVETVELQDGQIRRTWIVADRGERPATRGWFHVGAAFSFAIAAAVLITFAWMTLPWMPALGVTVYGAGLITLFGVSAMYHRWPWRSASAVQWWRRADHATIAVFIAATYTPLCLILFPPRTAGIMLAVAWVGAIAGAILNLVWIDHPRWLDVVVYVALGWIIVPLAPALWAMGGIIQAVFILLLIGGIIYTLGAVVYGFKWPGRSARIYGYHEHFHTATIVAAILHLVAIWIVVVYAG